MRRKRPPALSFLLRMDTLRRVARAVSLLALDFLALFLAIATALGLKAAARDTLDTSVVLHQAKDYVWFAFLVTALLFAKAGLYGDRAVRPGLSSIVASLFQVTVVIALYAIVSGQEFSSYYIFYGTLFFAVAYVSTFRFAYERTTGLLLRAAGYRAARCSWAPASTSRTWRTRCPRAAGTTSTSSASCRWSRGPTTG